MSYDGRIVSTSVDSGETIRGWVRRAQRRGRNEMSEYWDDLMDSISHGALPIADAAQEVRNVIRRIIQRAVGAAAAAAAQIYRGHAMSVDERRDYRRERYNLNLQQAVNSMTGRRGGSNLARSRTRGNRR